jgi:hypothetical protein
VRVVGLGQAPAGACGAGEHPFIAAGQGGQQVQHIRRCGNLACAFHLVADADSLPLGVYVLPAQRQHFARARTRQQHHLQAGGDNWVLYLLHGGKPCGQLLTL